MPRKKSKVNGKPIVWGDKTAIPQVEKIRANPSNPTI